MSTRAL